VALMPRAVLQKRQFSADVLEENLELVACAEGERAQVGESTSACRGVIAIVFLLRATPKSKRRTGLGGLCVRNTNVTCTNGRITDQPCSCAASRRPSSRRRHRRAATLSSLLLLPGLALGVDRLLQLAQLRRGPRVLLDERPLDGAPKVLLGGDVCVGGVGCVGG
jgi:hypothetical protein